MEEKTAKKTEVLVFTKGTAFLHVGELCAEIVSKGYHIVDSELMFLPDDVVRQHYAHVVDEPFFPEILNLFREHPVFLMKVCGTVDGIKSVVGKETDPLSCELFSFRSQRGKDKTDNAAHRSGSEEDAKKEIAFFFGKNGVVANYRRSPMAKIGFYNKLAAYTMKNT